ncbi:MAG: hypothetical protein FJY80_09160 [Candidatus Aminicenantes bacterium]|nr:hypothetical protein [Candidatus Aminicenantes bacterium]
MRIFRLFQRRERRLGMALLAAFMGFVVGPVWPAAEEDESSICLQAFSNCFVVAVAKAGGQVGMGLFYHLQFCIIGFSFCERYIAPYIDWL